MVETAMLMAFVEKQWKSATLIRFLITVVKRNRRMEYAIGAYRIDGGTTTCLVGFLPAVLVPHWKDYEDVLAQVVEVNPNATSYGSCVAMMIPEVTGVGHDIDSLPDISTKMVEDEQSHLFFGNKNSAKFIVNKFKIKE